MNGAMALDWENTIKSPKRTNTSTIGTSQYFFSWRRNRKNSERTRALLMSIHPLIVAGVPIPGRIRNPSGPGHATTGERVLPHQAPDQTKRHENQNEQQGQQ